eukprot:3015882-Rhodomonas_salina.1
MQPSTGVAFAPCITILTHRFRSTSYLSLREGGNTRACASSSSSRHARVRADRADVQVDRGCAHITRRNLSQNSSTSA